MEEGDQDLVVEVILTAITLEESRGTMTDDETLLRWIQACTSIDVLVIADRTQCKNSFGITYSCLDCTSKQVFTRRLRANA